MESDPADANQKIRMSAACVNKKGLILVLLTLNI